VPGVPVIAARIGGIPEIVIDGETGILVPPDDSAGLIDALVRLLADSRMRERLGEQAKARFQREFTHERMRDQLGAIYRTLLGRNGLRDASTSVRADS
jgi:glycosyltransferase involved in cell wall biosynthesis